jgi:hypothetical protein
LRTLWFVSCIRLRDVEIREVDMSEKKHIQNDLASTLGP